MLGLEDMAAWKNWPSIRRTGRMAWTPTCVVIHANGLRAWQGTGFLRSEISSGREYDGGGCASRLPYISLTGVESGEQERTRVQCATASEKRFGLARIASDGTLWPVCGQIERLQRRLSAFGRMRVAREHARRRVAGYFRDRVVVVPVRVVRGSGKAGRLWGGLAGPGASRRARARRGDIA